MSGRDYHLTCKRKEDRFLSQCFYKFYITSAASRVSLRCCDIHCGMVSQRNLIVCCLSSTFISNQAERDISLIWNGH